MPKHLFSEPSLSALFSRRIKILQMFRIKYQDTYQYFLTIFSNTPQLLQETLLFKKIHLCNMNEEIILKFVSERFFDRF